MGNTMLHPWETDQQTSVIPMDQDQIDSAFSDIVMPQMLRISFPTITNQMVWAVLMTSLGVTVGMNSDLYGVTQDLNALTFRTFELFAMAAVIFYVIVKIIQAGAWLISRRLFRY